MYMWQMCVTSDGVIYLVWPSTPHYPHPTLSLQPHISNSLANVAKPQGGTDPLQPVAAAAAAETLLLLLLLLSPLNIVPMPYAPGVLAEGRLMVIQMGLPALHWGTLLEYHAQVIGQHTRWLLLALPVHSVLVSITTVSRNPPKMFQPSPHPVSARVTHGVVCSAAAGASAARHQMPILVPGRPWYKGLGSCSCDW
jgi:hypothetical protein